MTADLTNSENRKQSFSLLYLGINIGTAVGTLMAGFLFEHYMALVFLGDAITTFMSLFLVYKFVDETIPTKEAMEEGRNLKSDEKTMEGGLISALLKRPLLLIFSLISLVYSFIYAQHSFIIPQQVAGIFGGDTGAKVFGSLMTVNALVVIFLTTFIVHLTRKMKPIVNIAFSGMFYAVGFGMLYFVKSYPLFILSTVIWTIGEILSMTNSGIYIADHTPMSHRGRFNSVIPVITGAGFSIGPGIMGMYIRAANIEAAWILVFVISMIAAFLMLSLNSLERSMRDKEVSKCG
jgi:MFS family permease